MKGRRRDLKDPVVSSHLLFLGNGLLYGEASFYSLAFVLVATGTVSFLHHLFHEENALWRQADRLGCIVALSLIFAHLFVYVGATQIGVCVAWLLFSLGLYKASYIHYGIVHTMWHFAVFVGNVLVWHYLGEVPGIDAP